MVFSNGTGLKVNNCVYFTCVVGFCSPRDLNPQSEEMVPKTTASTNFARRALNGEKGIRTLGIVNTIQRISNQPL